MSIYQYCRKCRSTSPIGIKFCSVCGEGFPREGGKFRVSVTVKGKTISRVLGSLAVAKETEASLRNTLHCSEIDVADHKEKNAVTLGEVWVKYLAWSKERKSSWKDDLINYQKHIEPRFGNSRLGEITPSHIEHMKIELEGTLNSQGRPYAAATINHQLGLLRRLFNAAIEYEMFDGRNPVGKATLPKVHNQVTEHLTDFQAINLLETLEAWPCRESAAFVTLAFLLGLSRGELLKLKWEDVDEEDGRICLKNSNDGHTTRLSLKEEALEAIKSLQPRTGEYVFCGEQGRQRRDFGSSWKQIREAAGLPKDFRFQGLRHSFTDRLIRKAVRNPIVQLLISYNVVRCPRSYAHLFSVQERSDELPKTGSSFADPPWSDPVSPETVQRMLDSEEYNPDGMQFPEWAPPDVIGWCLYLYVNRENPEFCLSNWGYEPILGIWTGYRLGGSSWAICYQMATFDGPMQRMDRVWKTWREKASHPCELLAFATTFALYGFQNESKSRTENKASLAIAKKLRGIADSLRKTYLDRPIGVYLCDEEIEYILEGDEDKMLALSDHSSLVSEVIERVALEAEREIEFETIRKRYLSRPSKLKRPCETFFVRYMAQVFKHYLGEYHKQELAYLAATAFNDPSIDLRFVMRALD